MYEYGELLQLGYPYKTPSQMGVTNELDAYCATQQAIYVILEGRDMTWYRAGEGDSRGEKILVAIDNLVKEGKNGTRTPATPTITFNKVGDIVNDGNYYSQRYSVDCSVDMENYTITSTTGMPTGGYIADTNGNEKTTFNKGQDFKVMIPKSRFTSDISITIKALGKCETYPILYGESPNSNWQDYALSYDPFSTNGGETKLNVDVFQCSLIINKKSKDTGENLQGVSYEIRYADNNSLIGNYTTNSSGKITVNNLRPGSIKIVEKSTLQEYIVDLSTHETVLEFKGSSTVNLTNSLKRGDLEVLKSSEDNMAAGLRFHLYGTSLSGIAISEYATTDSNGVARFKDILISGSQGYTLEEVDTPTKYVIPTPLNVSIKWNDVTKATVVNRLKKFRVNLTKTDKEIGIPQGNAKLAGAVYGIYKGNTLIDTYSTDSNGKFTTQYYTCGDDWNIKEISPSEGYLIDTTTHHVGAEAGNYTIEYNTTANSVVEQVIKGKIRIIKHTDDGSTKIETPEVGAKFEVYLKSAGSYTDAKSAEKDILICDENGFAETKLLPYGIYRIHQVSGWEGRELIADFDVYISENGKMYSLIMNNENFESYIKIVKKDAETNKTIPMAGTAFQIYDSNKKLITMTYTYPTITTIDTFYTNVDGYLVTPERLPYGNFYLKELYSPYRVCA